MLTKSRLSLAVFAGLLLLAACGGSDETPPTPAPTVDTFDTGLMTAIVLQPEDVGMAPTTRGFAADPSSPTYNVSYGDASFFIQSSLTRAPDPIDRDARFSSLRTFFAGYLGNERTLTLEGAERALAYESLEFNQPRNSVLVMSGDFVALIDIGSDQDARAADVHGRPIEDYMRLVLDRIVAAGQTPPAITPIPDAPTFPAGG